MATPGGQGALLATLGKLSIFAGIGEEALREVSRMVLHRKYARNATVVHGGDPTDYFYIIVSGSIKVLMSDEDGREVILSLLGPGDFFGEMGLLDNNPRSATVITTEPCEMLLISRLDFREFLRTHFDACMFIMRELVKRLRHADNKIESLALMDVYGRVAHLLLEFSEMKDGRRRVTRKITKQDIAKMIGASREMVSRVMKDLEIRGYIECEGPEIYINDE